MDNPQKINLNLSFEIPPEYVLITKAEYEELSYDRLVGWYWTMAELEERTKRKRLWLQENVRCEKWWVCELPQSKRRKMEFPCY